MKRYILLALVIVVTVAFVAVSAMSVSAASPLGRYYDQDGNKYWCNTDSYGCWVTGENGEHDYIMFWSEASRAKIMGPDSNAPLGIAYNSPEMPLKAPPTAIPTQSAPVIVSPTPGAPTATVIPTKVPTICSELGHEAECLYYNCEWSVDTQTCGENSAGGVTPTATATVIPTATATVIPTATATATVKTCDEQYKEICLSHMGISSWDDVSCSCLIHIYYESEADVYKHDCEYFGGSWTYQSVGAFCYFPRN